MKPSSISMALMIMLRSQLQAIPSLPVSRSSRRQADANTVTIQYGHGDYPGVVQYKAQPNDRDDREVEIVGHFNTGSSSRNFPAQSPVMIRIGNVAAGSGAAEITNPSSHSVKAGSKDNTIRIHFTAAGTMDGGIVRLRNADGWGDWQETDEDGDNYIDVMASNRVVDTAEISYGPRYVLVPITAAEKGTTITFVVSEAKVQTVTGLAAFRIESAGGPSDSLEALKGVPLPKDADDKDITDQYELLGEVFVPHMVAFDADVTGSQDAVDAASGLLQD